ncbi:hypothetical protein THAOC_10403 [Thalassiosira oceanica]|uniref:Uncharacterized protein n=1 Tax=Thalassiosira oceanica TaxID=159749 RepID=K0TD38_THAOC|nr:hypothetical protein THAOC_10403 [Thalassiosira oceanica]|eukprot:EJK68422.1 hypothetical protein THAOC_10403 [Thalassiosira oceanica]
MMANGRKEVDSADLASLSRRRLVRRLRWALGPRVWAVRSCRTLVQNELNTMDIHDFDAPKERKRLLWAPAPAAAPLALDCPRPPSFVQEDPILQSLWRFKTVF